MPTGWLIERFHLNLKNAFITLSLLAAGLSTEYFQCFTDYGCSTGSFFGFAVFARVSRVVVFTCVTMGMVFQNISRSQLFMKAYYHLHCEIVLWLSNWLSSSRFQ